MTENDDFDQQFLRKIEEEKLVLKYLYDRGFSSIETIAEDLHYSEEQAQRIIARLKELPVLGIYENGGLHYGIFPETGDVFPMRAPKKEV